MKSNTTKIISFLGGLAFFSIVATVLILKNDKLRSEIESQTKSLLDTSRNTIEQIQFVTGKIGKITGELKTDKENSNIASNGQTTLMDGYDSLWAEAESKLQA